MGGEQTPRIFPFLLRCSEIHMIHGLQVYPKFSNFSQTPHQRTSNPAKNTQNLNSNTLNPIRQSIHSSIRRNLLQTSRSRSHESQIWSARMQNPTQILWME